jgi:hypothetical protein
MPCLRRYPVQCELSSPVGCAPVGELELENLESENYDRRIRGWGKRMGNKSRRIRVAEFRVGELESEN